MDRDLKVAEWRKYRRVSDWTWHSMVRNGTAPEVLILGPRTKIVTMQSDARWMAARLAAVPTPTAEQTAHGRRMHAERKASKAASEGAAP